MTDLNSPNTGQNANELKDDVRTNAHNGQSQRRAGTGFAANVPFVQAAQIVSLQRDGVIDEAAASTILRAIDSVSMGVSAPISGVWATMAALDEKVDASLPRDISGAAALGRTRGETIATALRMQWREQGAHIASRSLDLRAALHELAQAHAVTVLGAFADRKAAAPSTLAHFLGGIIGPLDSTWKRFLSAIEAVNRSPFGSGLLVGEVFGADREHTASLLGFNQPIANTIDASGSIEDVIELLDAVAAQAAVIRRFVNELLIWIRTDPTSFFIDERWESGPEPAHAAHNVSTQLEHLNILAHRTELDARAATDQLRAQPYGPIGVAWDPLATSVNTALSSGEELVATTIGAVREALIVNRAYLANRAGRLYSTASDVAPFLMEDQQLNPADAQKIAGLSVARLKEASLEAAQITPDIIDAAAVMVIGQELKVEMETLGRYIAPRRYLERRDVLGSPKADRTRAWLNGVAERIERDRNDLDAVTTTWKSALGSMRATIAESAESIEN